MKKIFVFLIVLVSFFSKIEAQVNVKGLKLKYVLMHTAYDVYFYNNHMPFIWKFFQNEEAKFHNEFLKRTYHKLPKEKKHQLYTIFKKTHVYHYMNKLSGLSDTANVGMIIEYLTEANKNDTSINEALKSFLPYFYDNFLKAYILASESEIDSLANKVQLTINEKKIDILDFMEKESGVKFTNKYNVQLYYTLGFRFNMGFKINDVKISTISQNSRSVEKILGTVFHEFSHELFQTFTKSEEFKTLADSLKSDKKFYEYP